MQAPSSHAPSGPKPSQGGKTAVVLCSGGLDSATCLGIAVADGYDVVALSFDYGQRHKVELSAAKRLAEHYRVRKHLVSQIGVLREIGGSALTSDGIDVPQHDSRDGIGSDIPVTYVPARNLIFLAQATAVAEVYGAEAIFIGVNALDYSGYPDCRPEFIEAFANVARLATKVGTQTGGVRIEAPLQSWTKAQIISRGSELRVPYELTVSCYSPSDQGHACGRCDSCWLRRSGFEEAKVPDPTMYAPGAT